MDKHREEMLDKIIEIVRHGGTPRPKAEKLWEKIQIRNIEHIASNKARGYESFRTMDYVHKDLANIALNWFEEQVNECTEVIGSGGIGVYKHELLTRLKEAR